MSRSRSRNVLAPNEARPFLETIRLRTADQMSEASSGGLKTDELIDDLLVRYEFGNFNHALEILSTSCREEWMEMLLALSSLRVAPDDLQDSEENGAAVVCRLESLLAPFGWRAEKMSAELIIRRLARIGDEYVEAPGDMGRVPDYFAPQRFDFVKGPVACDVARKSPNRELGEDLKAFGTYCECGAIEAGILVARSGRLEEPTGNGGSRQRTAPPQDAGVAGTEELIESLESGRGGGAPVLLIGLLLPDVTPGRTCEPPGSRGKTA